MGRAKCLLHVGRSVGPRLLSVGPSSNGVRLRNEGERPWIRPPGMPCRDFGVCERSGCPAISAKEPRPSLFSPNIVQGRVPIRGAKRQRSSTNRRGRSAGYYNISAASFGLQAGGQPVQLSLCFSHDRLRAQFIFSGVMGGRSGSGAHSVVVVDQGAAKSFTTTTLTYRMSTLSHVRPKGVDGRHEHQRIEDHGDHAQLSAIRYARYESPNRGPGEGLSPPRTAWRLMPPAAAGPRACIDPGNRSN